VLGVRASGKRSAFEAITGRVCLAWGCVLSLLACAARCRVCFSCDEVVDDNGGASVTVCVGVSDVFVCLFAWGSRRGRERGRRGAATQDELSLLSPGEQKPQISSSGARNTHTRQSDRHASSAPSRPSVLGRARARVTTHKRRLNRLSLSNLASALPPRAPPPLPNLTQARQCDAEPRARALSHRPVPARGAPARRERAQGGAASSSISGGGGKTAPPSRARAL
jgi:hypothetical protein